jgi:hypothetical protein
MERAPELSEDLRRRLAAPRAGVRWWGLATAGAVALVVVAALLWPRAAPVGAPIGVEHLARLGGEAAVGDTVPEREAQVVEPASEEAVEQQAPRPEVAVADTSRTPEPSGELMVSAPPESAKANAPPVEEFTGIETEEPVGGVILVLGEPEPVLPSSRCYLEVSFPNGAKSVVDERIERDALGRPRASQLSYWQVEADAATLSHGG